MSWSLAPFLYEEENGSVVISRAVPGVGDLWVCDGGKAMPEFPVLPLWVRWHRGGCACVFADQMAH